MTPSKYAAKQTGYVVLALICMIGISVAVSFINAGLDPAKLTTTESITNMCINAAITIFGIVSAIPLGVTATKQMTTPNGSLGRYSSELADYTKVRTAVEPKRKYFNQWHNKQYLNEKRQKYLNLLADYNIPQPELMLKLSTQQVLEMYEPQKYIIDGNEVYFNSLTYEQIRIVYNVLSGKVSVKRIPDFYFMYAEGKSSASFYEQAYHQSQSMSAHLVSRLLYKLFIGFVTTSCFTSLVISKVIIDEDMTTGLWILRAVISILARVFNAVTSTYWGYQIGCEQVYKTCYYINGKTQFLKLFLEDDSKMLDEQELAKQNYLTTHPKTKGEDVNVESLNSCEESDSVRQ